MERTTESKLVKTLGVLGGITGFLLPPTLTSIYTSGTDKPAYIGASLIAGILLGIIGTHYGAILGRKLERYTHKSL
ncbi:MAG: hypothetical protein ACP5D2_03050 [Candidatus Nanoarchaeia archaeon]